MGPLDIEGRAGAIKVVGVFGPNVFEDFGFLGLREFSVDDRLHVDVSRFFKSSDVVGENRLVYRYAVRYVVKASRVVPMVSDIGDEVGAQGVGNDSIDAWRSLSAHALVNPVFAVSMLRFVLGPVIEDVVGDAAVHGGRNGVGDVGVDVYVTAKVVWSVFELVHSDDGGGEETLVVVVDFAVSVGSRVAIDIGYDDVLVLNVSGDNDLGPSSCGFEQVGVVVVVLAGDGLSGGDSSDAFSTSCVLGGGQIGGGWESDMSFCIFCLVADSGNEVLGYVSFLNG